MYVLVMFISRGGLRYTHTCIKDEHRPGGGEVDKWWVSSRLIDHNQSLKAAQKHVIARDKVSARLESKLSRRGGSDKLNE